MGLWEMRWKNFGEMSTDDGHKVFFSGEEGKHEYGVGFLVHKDVVGAVLGCQPVSSRLIYQIEYILVKKRFRSGVNIHRTRSFPGADIGSDHDLEMMTIQVRLKMARKPNQTTF